MFATFSSKRNVRRQKFIDIWKHSLRHQDATELTGDRAAGLLALVSVAEVLTNEDNVLGERIASGENKNND